MPTPLFTFGPHFFFFWDSWNVMKKIGLCSCGVGVGKCFRCLVLQFEVGVKVIIVLIKLVFV